MTVELLLIRAADVGGRSATLFVSSSRFGGERNPLMIALDASCSASRCKTPGKLIGKRQYLKSLDDYRLKGVSGEDMVQIALEVGK